jgi:hypothetical protein
MPEINQQKTVKVQAKTLKIHSKIRDMFQAELVDQDGSVIHTQEDGYVPGFMPGEHYGDYLILDIDLDTGKILNWKPPTAEKLEAWMAG